jgi:hypothetical protein
MVQLNLTDRTLWNIMVHLHLTDRRPCYHGTFEPNCQETM